MMKKVLFLLLCLSIASPIYAGVRSLADSGESTEKSSSSKSQSKNKNQDYVSSQPVVNIKSIDTGQRCIKAGFTMKECPSGYIAVYPCPENPRYFRDCCPQEYRFTETECRQQGLEPSPESCLTFHACRQPQPQQTETATDTATGK